MNAFIKIIIIIYFAGLGFVNAQSIELANEYYLKGEYEKAEELYSKLSSHKESNRAIHDNYLHTLNRLRKFDTAEKYVLKEIKENPEMIVYRAELAYLYENSEQAEKAETSYKELINEAAEKDVYVYQLQNFFYETNKMELLIDLLLKSRERSKTNSKHSIQLARAYLYSGNKKSMLDEVFKYGIENRNTDYVERTIQDNIKEEAEKQMLERMLYENIQEHPSETLYTEILIWYFVQEKEFNRAFMQARALDRRLQQDGGKIYQLALIAYKNDFYRESGKMFQYIMQEYPHGDYYPYARRMNIQCKEQTVKNTFPLLREDIMGLIEQYDLLLSDLGKTTKTLDALRNMALLYAFYLDEPEKGIAILEEAIRIGGSNQMFKDLCKLDLGDIYILKNEPWESTLLYMQVEKSEKTEQIGEIAKLKNAKLYYYTGEFELAVEILDILKKATTREIANDAMELSLLIQDNLGLDTTDAALKAYAAVDLLLFQNKKEKAVKELDSLYLSFKSNSIADEMLWLKAKTEHELGRNEKAIEDLKLILENYKYDILGDDALFLLANIYEKNDKNSEEAMNYYRQLLEDYPGSIYGAESRKKFRTLRGDFVF